MSDYAFYFGIIGGAVGIFYGLWKGRKTQAKIDTFQNQFSELMLGRIERLEARVAALEKGEE